MYNGKKIYKLTNLNKFGTQIYENSSKDFHTEHCFEKILIRDLERNR